MISEPNFRDKHTSDTQIIRPKCLTSANLLFLLADGSITALLLSGMHCPHVRATLGVIIFTRVELTEIRAL